MVSVQSAVILKKIYMQLSARVCEHVYKYPWDAFSHKERIVVAAVK